MADALTSYLQFLDRFGVRYQVRDDLFREADFRGDLRPKAPTSQHDFGPGLVIEERLDAERSIGADHATLSVAEILIRDHRDFAGRSFCEIGCGSAMLSLIAARRRAQVTATDVDEDALVLARENSIRAGVDIDFRTGSLLDPLRADERFEIFVTNLPHKPASVAEGLPLAQAGGEEGTKLYDEAFAGMASRQLEGDLVYFFQHSLPHPRLLSNAARTHDLSLCSWKLRWLAEGEYGDLRDRFRNRHRDGRSFLHESDGEEALVAAVWRAQRRATDAPRTR